MTQIAIQHVSPVTNPNQLIPHVWDNPINIGTVLAGREDDVADLATITLLHEVEALRRQLRILEPQLSKMVTDFGKRLPRVSPAQRA
jgi:hypothetical protein